MTNDYISQCIARALKNDVELPDSVYKIRGFATPTMRRLIHALCAYGKITYLEVGTYCGASFVSSFHGDGVSIGVDNWSQGFNSVYGNEEFSDNVEKHMDHAGAAIVCDKDAFSIDLAEFPENIDIYYYDGEHSEESQAKALPYFFPNLSDTFIFIVDDTNWPQVKSGTEKGFLALKDKIKILGKWSLTGTGGRHDDAIWHNGMMITLIQKIHGDISSD